MKHGLLRHISLLLAAAMLLTGVSAAQSAAQSTDAMAFAVDNEILLGTDQGELCPQEAATRAELAAMLTRLFGAAPQELPAHYEDCLRGAWYYHPMAAAVKMGFLSQTSDATLGPEQTITREEAALALCRAFRLNDADTSVLDAYSDRDAVSKQAASAMAALVCAGALSEEKRLLRPQEPMLRQELAQAIQCLTGEIMHAGDEAKPEYQNLLLADCGALPEGTVIHGDLLIGGKAPERISLTEVTIEGRLLVFGRVEIKGGNASEVELLSDCTLDTQLGTLTLCTDGTSVSFSGNAEKTELYARHAELSGSGNAGQVTNYGVGSEVFCARASYVEKIDAGLDGVTPIQENTPTVNRKNNIAELTVRFENIDTTHVYGVSKSGRGCTLNWYVNGSRVKTTPYFLLKEGAAASAKLPIPFERETESTITAALELIYRDQTLRLPLCIEADNSGAEAYYEAREIPTSHVLATMLYSCTASDGTPLEAGDTVYYMGGSDYIQIPGGRFTFVPAGSFEIIDDIYYDSSVQYSGEVAEAFVNEVNSYSSQTDFLIWCSLYSQHVYVFSGTQGSWKLQCHGRCASGKNYSPTRPGVYRIYSKEPQWDFDGYIVEYPCAFDADVAFHSVTKFYGGGILDDTLGTPISHGCVRLPDELIGYIYENCPIDTTVVVW